MKQRLARILLSIGLIGGALFAPTTQAQTRTVTTYMGAYSSGTTYHVNDMVASGGATYISLIAINTGHTPASSPTQWSVIGGGGLPAGCTSIAGGISCGTLAAGTSVGAPSVCVGSDCRSSWPTGGGGDGMVPVENYGAVGDADGIAGHGTNNTAAVQACLNGLLSGNQFNACYFAAGKKYRITGPVNINRSSIGMVCGGFGTSVLTGTPGTIVIDSASANAVNIGPSSGRTAWNFLTGCAIQRTVLPTGTAKAISAVAADGLQITNVYGTDNIQGLYMFNTNGDSSGRIENVAFFNQLSGYGSTPTWCFYLDSDSNTTHQHASVYFHHVTCSDFSNDVNNVGFGSYGMELNDVTVDQLETNTNGIGLDINYTGSDGLWNFDQHFRGLVLQSRIGWQVQGITNPNGGVEIGPGWVYANAYTPGSYFDIENSVGVTVSHVQFLNFANGLTATAGLIHNSSSIGFDNNDLNAASITLNNVTGSVFNGNKARSAHGATLPCVFCLVGSSGNAIGPNSFSAATGDTITNTVSFDSSSIGNEYCMNVASAIGGTVGGVLDSGVNLNCTGTTGGGIGSLATGLIESWGSQDGAGTTLANTGSDTSNTATTHNVTWAAATGFTGNVASYNGSTSYSETASASSTAFTGGTPFSVCGWVTPSSGFTATTSTYIFSNLQTGGYPGWALGTSLSGGVQEMHFFLTNTPATNQIETYSEAASGLVAGVLSPVCMAYDGSRTAAGVKIYVNGSLLTAWAGPIDNLTGSIASTQPLDIGNAGPSGQFFPGAIAHVHIYSRALSGAEVALFGSLGPSAY